MDTATIIMQDFSDSTVYHATRFGTDITFKVEPNYISVWFEDRPVDTIALRDDDNPKLRMFDWIDTALPF